MNDSTQISQAIVDAGLLNSKTFCIKNLGSTFVCTCNNCARERQLLFREFITKVESIDYKLPKEKFTFTKLLDEICESIQMVFVIIFY